MKFNMAVAGFLIPALVLVGGITIKADEGASSPLPHGESLQKHFQAILGADTQLALVGRMGDLRQAVIKEKLGSQELASALLKFILENQNPKSILLVSPVLEAADAKEVARIWTAALASKDEKMRQLAPSLLQFLEHGRSGEPGFEVYTSLLAEKPQAMPTPLIEYMYARDGSQAFLSILRATRDDSAGHKKNSDLRQRELFFAHHMIEHAVWLLRNHYQESREDAMKAASGHIASLAEAPEWWVRYYAAKTVVDHSEFRTDALVKKFAGDSHESVRKLFGAMVPTAVPPENQP